MYKYKALERGQFRLLTLLSITTESDHVLISFELKHEEVESAPPFYAVSYSWEGQSPCIPTTCDGGGLLITPTLFAFFMFMFQEKNFGPFWIDAISIQQDDPVEKAAQVKVLDSYFAKASAVLAWLGPSTEPIDEFFDRVLTPLESAEDGEQVMVPPADQDSLVWPGFLELLDRSWFRRLWIVQEAVLNQKVRMYWGSNSCDINSLVNLIKRMTHLLGPLVKRMEYTAAMWLLFQLPNLREWRSTEGLALNTLIEFCRDREVYLDVDRLYGLMGLLTPEDRQRFEVDYSKENVDNPYRMFVDVGHLLMCHEPYMDALQEACLVGVERRLPSWCPDLRHDRKDYVQLQAIGLYQAGGGVEFKSGAHNSTFRVLPTITMYRPHPWMACSLDRSRILLRGILIGMITACGMALPHGPLPAVARQDRASRQSGTDVAPSVLSWLISWGAFCLDRDPGIQDTPREDIEAYRRAALGRCLVGNRKSLTGPGMRASASERAYEHNPPLGELLGGLKTLVNTLEDILRSTSGRESGAYEYTYDTRCMQYMHSSTRFMKYRRPFRIDKADQEWIGVGPEHLQEGDCVVVFRYTRVPFILRPCSEDGDRWSLVGEAYVEGLMYGEAFEDPDIDDEQLPLFWLE